MGGSLTATSHPEGEGAEFVARVPLSSITGELQLSLSSPPRRPVDGDFARRHPLSILVVEDDPVNLRLILTMLRKLGYEPLFAKDGADAVRVYRGNRPQCILMDVQMPLMDGIEATAEIRRLEALQNARPTFIGALTANTLASDRDRCLQSGMDKFLNKPLRYEHLTDLLKTASLHAAAWAPGNN
jgi:CheY-like chemotaxis protein